MSLNPYEPPQTIDCARKPPARWNPSNVPWPVIYLLTSFVGAVIGVSLEAWINPGRDGAPFPLFLAYYTPLTCGVLGLAAGVAYQIISEIRAARTETIASPESDD